MGLFKNLFGKGKVSKDDPFSPRYKEIRKWIESRIGPMNREDSNLVPNLNRLLKSELNRLAEPTNYVNIAYNKGNTIITGDTEKIKGQLKWLGCHWDDQSHSWIARGKYIREGDVKKSRRISGLEAYIKKVEYRVRVGGSLGN